LFNSRVRVLSPSGYLLGLPSGVRHRPRPEVCVPRTQHEREGGLCGEERIPSRSVEFAAFPISHCCLRSPPLPFLPPHAIPLVPAAETVAATCETYVSGPPPRRRRLASCAVLPTSRALPPSGACAPATRPAPSSSRVVENGEGGGNIHHARRLGLDHPQRCVTPSEEGVVEPENSGEGDVKCQ